jgi:cell cycle protein kinase DBF2
MYDMPGTPTRQAFTSPQQTPQGSPSKHQAPPGAYDLPNVFENAMKLQPTFGTPSKNGQNQQSLGSPGKKHGHDVDDSYNDYSVIQQSAEEV